MTQLVQTLGQLTAGILSTALVVPFYSYYVRGSIFPGTTQVVQVNEYIDTTSDTSKGDLNVETDVGHNSDVDDDGDADCESSDLEEIQ